MTKSKKLLLHIGTGKTGSTSIQDTFYKAYQNALLGDLTYPSFMGKRHHNGLCSLVMPHERVRRDIRSRFPEDNSDYRAYVEALQTQAQKKLTAAGDTIISGEYFCGFNEDEAKALLTFFRSCGYTEIHVLLYFREPVTLYLSQIQQRVKASAHFANPKSYCYEYTKIIDCWAPLVTSISVREFSREALTGGDAVSDFSATVERVLNCSIELPKSNIQTSNESLTTASIALMQGFRKQHYAGKDNFFDEKTVRLIDLLLEVESTVDYTNKPKLRKDIEQLLLFKHQEQLRLLEKTTGLDLLRGRQGKKPNISRDLSDICSVIEYTEDDQRAQGVMMLALLHRLL